MKEKSDNKIWILFVSIIFVIMVWFGSYWYIETNFGKYETKGQVGDMFGAINSLFSGLAFAGLIYAIYLQNKELKLQKEELKKTQEIAEAQEKALRSQAESQNLAVFQAAFTQMLEIHFRLMDSYAEGNMPGSQFFNGRIALAYHKSTLQTEISIINQLDPRMYRHLFHISQIIDLIIAEFPSDRKKQNIYLLRLSECLSYHLRLYINKAVKFKYYIGIKSNLLRLIEHFGELESVKIT